MNKKQLIEAIADYPDDAQVVVSGGLGRLIERGTLAGDSSTGLATVWSVSSNPTIINLEL